MVGNNNQFNKLNLFKMKTKNSGRFQELVKGMQVLEDTEKGMLKGGFSKSFSFQGLKSSVTGNNCTCTVNNSTTCNNEETTS